MKSHQIIASFEEFKDDIYDLAFEKFDNKCQRQNLTKLGEVDFQNYNITLRPFWKKMKNKEINRSNILRYSNF